MVFMSQFRAIVTGRVQGVCFRAETVATARKLGLSGYAKNLPDGTVEVVASGDEKALHDLEAYIHEGPTLARVDRVDADWTDQTPTGGGFNIRYG